MNITRKHWRAEVVWDDSRIIGGAWGSVKDALAVQRRFECRSVGFVLADNERGMVLAGSVNVSGNVTGCIAIPRSQIRKVIRLRPCAAPEEPR